MYKTLLACSTSLILAACGGDDGHDHDHDHDGGAPGDVTLAVTSTSPASVPVDTTLTVTWTVANNTSDDLHVSELRWCPGADVANCGLGEASTYTSTPGTLTDVTYSADVTMDTAGDFTVVAYAHVGAFPYTSSSFNVNVQQLVAQ